jgi:hypothetical protein
MILLLYGAVAQDGLDQHLLEDLDGARTRFGAEPLGKTLGHQRQGPLGGLDLGHGLLLV